MVPSKVPVRGLATVVTGTYNEAENIRELVERVLKNDVALVIVDDNSPDGTTAIVRSLQKKYKNLFLVQRAGKLGYGSAYVEGFRYALEKLRAPFVISIDADLSHDPGIIPKLLEKSEEGYHVVIGSRYVAGGGTSWTLYRRFMSFGANLLARLFLGIPAHDVTSGFRCYRAHVLRNIELFSLKSEGYSFLQEILFRALQKGFSVAEVPIFFQDRREGKSKLSKKEMINFFKNLVRLRFGG